MQWKNIFKQKTDHNAKIKDIEDKIPHISKLATNTTLSNEINKVKGEIPLISNLAIIAVLKTVDNKIPNQSNYTTTPEFIEIAENLTAKVK